MIDEYKMQLKIGNPLYTIIRCEGYKSFAKDYDNTLKAQKDFLKENLIPKLKDDIKNILNECKNIEMNSIRSKYFKDEKYILLEFEYLNKEEVLSYVCKAFKELENKLNSKLIEKYSLCTI
jgi:hypothetical protein